MGKIAGVEINTKDQDLIGKLNERGHIATGSDAVIAWPVLVRLDRSSGMAYGAGQPGAKTCAALMKP
jgi:hypothetical protein